MKPGILSATALFLALGFTSSVNAQINANPNSQITPTDSALDDREATRSDDDATLAAAIALNKQAIVALSRFFDASNSLATDSVFLPLQSTHASEFSPELPPLAAANFYLPEIPPSMTGYIWPARGQLSSGYGWRWGRMHAGIDIAAPIGTPILAAAPGIVITAEWHTGGYGNLVEIQHPDGSITLYAHNNRILVNEGDRVEGGETIAEMGSTGFSTGPHLHFEVHLPEGGAVNPLAYLPDSGLAARLP